MNINTKFNPEQAVWFLNPEKIKIEKGFVEAIEVYLTKDVQEIIYKIKGIYSIHEREKREDEIFATKEELINQLQ